MSFTGSISVNLLSRGMRSPKRECGIEEEIIVPTPKNKVERYFFFRRSGVRTLTSLERPYDYT